MDIEQMPSRLAPCWAVERNTVAQARSLARSGKVTGVNQKGRPEGMGRPLLTSCLSLLTRTNMDINEALSRYLTQLRADGRSEHTACQYRRHITLLLTWLHSTRYSAEVARVDHETLAQFLSSPCARTRPDGGTKKATSTNALRTSLRTFFRYCHEAGYVRSNPARLIRRALCGTPPIRALSEDEQGRLIKALAEGTGLIVERDRMLFVLLLGSGIRIGSALALDVGDVDLERGELALRKTKGDVPTSVPLARSLRDHLHGFIGGRTTGPLFRGANGRAMSARHVQRRLQLWCGRAGIGRNVSPHSLRHSFAIRIYRKTRDLLLVQAALRHRSIASTTVYARTDDAAVRAAVGG
jgi:site-specific recombinase XerC